MVRLVISVAAIALVGCSAESEVPESVETPSDLPEPSPDPITETGLVDGGICTGLALVPRADADDAVITQGPDFTVFYADGSEAPLFGVYSGWHPQVGRDPGDPFMTLEEYDVFRTSENGEFAGYLLANSSQFLVNHFFGRAFADAPSDRAFFESLVLGDEAANACSQATGIDQ